MRPLPFFPCDCARAHAVWLVSASAEGHAACLPERAGIPVMPEMISIRDTRGDRFTDLAEVASKPIVQQQRSVVLEAYDRTLGKRDSCWTW